MSGRQRILVLSSSRWHGPSVLSLVRDAGHAPFLATHHRDLRPEAAIEVLELEPILRTAPERTLSCLGAFARRHDIDVVVPAGTADTLWLVRHGAALEPAIFPLPDEATFHDLRDKARFARLAERLGIAHPRTIHVREPEDVVDPPCPCVVKPVRGEGGEHVTRIDDPREVAPAARAVMAACRDEVIVQAFVEGRDVDLSLLADGGRIVAHTVQTMIEGRLAFVEHDDVLAIGAALFEATRCTGLAHIDMRIEEGSGRVVVIEANPRVWATIRESARHGVDFVEIGVRMARRRA